MCPGFEDLGAGGCSSVLQTPTTPCKHTVSVRRPVLSRSNPGRKDAGGGGGLSTRLSLLLSLLLSHPTDTATHLHLFTPIRSLGLRIPPQASFHPSAHTQTVLLWANPCTQIRAPVCLARSPDSSTCRHQARFAQAGSMLQS